MSERSDWRDEAELTGKLAATMVSQLERNRQHKTHWRAEGVSVDYLVRRLREEVEELVENPSSWEEAADVANFAAMIVDASEAGD